MVALPITNPTLEKIYAAYEKKRKEEKRRGYLGMSELGGECERAMWLNFRWAGGAPEQFTGRMVRLFQTGHREETRLVQDLIDAGITVRFTGENQQALTGIMGHLGGHPDGEAEGFEEAPRAIHILEAKTHNLKSFKDLISKGVKLSKPVHFAQIQLYMHFTGHRRTFYIAVNKDTDELYQERIAYDEVEALRLLAKAERIIKSNVIPPKISEKPDFFGCMFCKHHQFCHAPKGIFSARTCRTCLSSTPVEGGFRCDVFDQVNDIAMQEAGCSRHLYLPDLVPGQQLDADPENRTVTYQLRDGKTFIDGEVNV